MGSLLVVLLQLASLLLLARAALSWFPIGRDSSLYPVHLFVHRVTEPVLGPVRQILPRTGPLDLSLLAVLIIINFVLTPIARTL